MLAPAPTGMLPYVEKYSFAVATTVQLKVTGEDELIAIDATLAALPLLLSFITPLSYNVCDPPAFELAVKVACTLVRNLSVCDIAFVYS